MAKNRLIRYYSEEDFDGGVTRAKLKRLGRSVQKEYMIHWFNQNFEDPANETPYNNREGGYIYIWGGPYDAAEQLFDEFGDIIPEERIREVVDEVESGGLTDWAPGPRHPDHQRAREEWAADSAEVDGEDSPLQQMIEILESGAVPRFGSEEERFQRSEIISRLDALEARLGKLRPAHGGIGHNGPPEESAVLPAVEDAQLATTEIRGELLKETPNALVVARAASRLQSAVSWLLKKVDMAADAFAKSVGDLTGKAIVGVVGAYCFYDDFSGIVSAASDIVSSTVSWMKLISMVL